MSTEVETPTEAAPEQHSVEDKAARCERVLKEVLELMGVSTRMEMKDGADGGISVALFPEGEIPGAPPGRRSPVLDSLQFLVNKAVNRTPENRRWVSIGIGAHPEPRLAAPPPRPQPAAPAPVVQRAPTPRPTPVAPATEERTAEVPEDPALALAARELATKSAKLGRYYGIAPMAFEDRARVVQSVEDVDGVSVRVEGEGRSRRVVFMPDKPAPMPRRRLAEYDEGLDEESD